MSKRYPAVPVPTTEQSLLRTVMALKEGYEVLTAQRGSSALRVATFEDVESLADKIQSLANAILPLVNAGPLLITLSADFTTTASSMQPVTGMAQPVGANEVWKIEVWGKYQTAATTTGAGMSLALPTGSSVSGRTFMRQGDNGTDSFNEAQISVSGADITSASVQTAGIDWVCGMWALVATGNTAGDIQLLFRSEVSGSDATLRAGTKMLATKVA